MMTRMARRADALECSEKDRKALQYLSQRTAENDRVAARARLILYLLEGKSIRSAMEKFSIDRSMAFRWRTRFQQEGVQGLWDRPRTGKPAVYDAAFEARVLNALETPPEGEGGWDGNSLARHLGASADAVWRVLRKHGVPLARQRVWNIPVDFHQPEWHLEFAGLFIAPPVWMIALSQAGSNQGVSRLTTRDRKAAEALFQAYDEEGGLSLTRALALMAGVSGEMGADYKRREDIIAFLDDTLAAQRPGSTLEVMTLGGVAYADVRLWQMEHPQVRFHIYGAMEEGAQAMAAFLPSPLKQHYADLIAQVRNYPENAQSFVWKKMRGGVFKNLGQIAKSVDI